MGIGIPSTAPQTWLAMTEHSFEKPSGKHLLDGRGIKIGTWRVLWCWTTALIRRRSDSVPKRNRGTLSTFVRKYTIQYSTVTYFRTIKPLYCLYNFYSATIAMRRASVDGSPNLNGIRARSSWGVGKEHWNNK